MGLAPWKRTLYIILCAQFIAIAGVSMVFPFLPLYLQDLGVHNKSTVAFYAGVASLCSGFSMFIGAPVWGAIADRFGRKPSLLRAYAGAMTATALQAFNHSLPLFFVFLAMQGGFSGTPSAAAALLASTTPKEKVAYSLGLLQVSFFVAGVTGPLIGGFLAGAIGIRHTFMIASAGFFCAAVLVFLTVKEDFHPPAIRRGPFAMLINNFREASKSPDVLKMIGVIFLINSAASFARPLISLYVKSLDPGGNTSQEAGFVFAAFAFSSAVAAFIAGNVSVKVGYRKMLILTLTCTGLAYLPVGLAGSVIALIGMMAVVGAFDGANLPTASALLSLTSTPEKQGAVFGFAGSAQALANAFAPFIGGLIAATLGVRTVFGIVGVLVLTVGLIASRLLPKPSETETPDSGSSDLPDEAPGLAEP